MDTRRARTGEPNFPPLPAERFGIIYADPPWDYKGQLQHAGPASGDTGGAVRHYATVTLDDLKKLPVESVAADGLPPFPVGHQSRTSTRRLTSARRGGSTGPPSPSSGTRCRVNPGFYTMSQCELCLVFRRGRIPTPRGARNERQMVCAERGPHSQKPDEVRRRIERMFPEQRKIELFARRRVPGWCAWGLESDGRLPASPTDTGSAPSADGVGRLFPDC